MDRRQLLGGVIAVPLAYSTTLSKGQNEEFYLPLVYQCNACFSVMLINSDDLQNVTIECPSSRCEKQGLKYRMPKIVLERD